MLEDIETELLPDGRVILTINGRKTVLQTEELELLVSNLTRMWVHSLVAKASQTEKAHAGLLKAS